MLRRIIEIDEAKCNGCGACATACHEGAIGMINGKAKLLRDDYCDGLGDCLPTCPTKAISFVEREAAAYDEAAVKANQKKKAAMQCGCSGQQVKTMSRNSSTVSENEQPSQLAQWPVQIKLVPVNAPYFEGAELLIAADCTAYAYASFHSKFIKGRITLIGCPKLDSIDYAEKLTEIIQNNSIKSITVVRMEVPCCGGIENAVHRAVKASGKALPCKVNIISTTGEIIS